MRQVVPCASNRPLASVTRPAPTPDGTFHAKAASLPRGSDLVVSGLSHRHRVLVTHGAEADLAEFRLGAFDPDRRSFAEVFAGRVVARPRPHGRGGVMRRERLKNRQRPAY